MFGLFSGKHQLRQRPVVRIFLSYPNSAKEMASAAQETIEEIFGQPPYRNRVTAEVGMWSDDRLKMSLPHNERPNDYIFDFQGAPKDADLFFVFVKDRIGRGTMDEVRNRLEAEAEPEKKRIYTFWFDQAPKAGAFHSVADYERAHRDYMKLSRWCGYPFWEDDDGQEHALRPDQGFGEPNPIESLSDLKDRLRYAIGRFMQDADVDQSQQAPTIDPRVTPYPGPRAMSPDYTPFLFGRDRDLDELIRKIQAGGQPILLYGASGTGKSSLVNAGVCGRLRQSDNDHWVVLPLTPGRDPECQLARALMAAELHTLTDADDLVEAALIAEPETELSNVGQRLGGSKLLVYIDQFEQCYQVSQRRFRDFEKMLRVLFDHGATILITHRADQMHQFSAREFLVESALWSQQVLRPVQIQYLRDVIIEPCRVASKPLPEAELVDALFEDFARSANSLPLLALALRTLYDKTGNGQRPMTLTDYDNEGRLSGMVERRAQRLRAVMRRSGVGAEELQRTFRLIVDVNSAGEASAIGAPRDKVVEILGEDALQSAIASFFLRSADDDGAITLAHEVYFDQWPELREWLDENRKQLRELRELIEDAHRWDRRQRSASFVIKGERLVAAKEIYEDSKERLTPADAPIVADFLNESERANDEELCESAIVNGKFFEFVTLHQKGVRPPAPMAGERLEPFYDAIWGPEERSPELVANVDISTPLNQQSVRAPVVNGFGAMHFAAAAGRVDKIRRIRALGCPVDLLSSFHSTPLSVAAYAGHGEAVGVLLAMGADPGIANKESGMTAAGWAAQRGYPEIVAKLLGDDNEGALSPALAASLVSGAVCGDDVQQLRRYVARAPVEGRADVLKDGLKFAAANLQPEALRILLQGGADPLVTFGGREDDATALILALKYGADDTDSQAKRIAIVETLLSARQELAVKPDEDGLTPLHFCAVLGRLECVPLLLDVIPDDQVDVVSTKHGVTPLFAAANEGVAHVQKIIGLLVARGASLESRGRAAQTPLIVAATKGRYDAVIALLAAGADAKAVDQDGDSALANCAISDLSNEPAMVDALIEAGTDVNGANGKGHTPLMLAARRGKGEMVERLLVNDASINAVDKFGWTAINHAAHDSHGDIVARLIQAGGRLPLWTAEPRFETRRESANLEA